MSNTLLISGYIWEELHEVMLLVSDVPTGKTLPQRGWQNSVSKVIIVILTIMGKSQTI